MTNEDFDFQPLAGDRNILSLEDFKTQEQPAPGSSSARSKKKKEDPSESEPYEGFESIEMDMLERRKAQTEEDDDDDRGTVKKKVKVKKKGKTVGDGTQRSRRRNKHKDDYVPYSEAPEGDWSGFESAAVTDDDGEGNNYPADGSRLVDAYELVENAEYEKVNISQEEARGLISYEALRDMCNEFTKIQGAGVSLRGALRIVKEQTEDDDLKDALNKVYEGIKMGDDLSEAMNKCKCFPFAFTIAVSAAEKNDMIAPLFGRFGEIFAAEVREKEHRKVSIFYPLLTTGCALFVMIILCVIAFPAFVDMLGASGLESSGIFSVAETVRKIWWLLLILLALIFAGLIMFKVARENDLLGAKIKEKTMTEDSYERMTVYVKFVRYMNALLRVGVATKDALFVTAHSFYNHSFITNILLEAANAAAEGSTLSNALCVSDFFPMMILQMISVGEEMGDTPAMLEYIGSYYEEEAERKEAEERAAKGPVTVAVMAASVLLLLLMMLLPMLSLFNAVGGLR